MHLGMGLYRHMLHRSNYQFVRQCGATHVVVHLVDYFAGSSQQQRSDQPLGNLQGWGFTKGDETIWEYDSLCAIKKQINDAGLIWEAIENFDPAHWSDILLDGPRKEQQVERIKKIIRNVGRAGIPIIGYNFSLAGVAGRSKGQYARGEAISVGMDGTIDQTPIPTGMVWNMQYEENPQEGFIPWITHQELWRRFAWFLEQVLPVAEEAGVKMAAHPDDPPVPYIRDTPRLVYQPYMYQQLLDLHKSNHNVLEYCLGSLAEMTEGDLYQSTQQYAQQQKIGYVHFRNVKGKVPSYREVFIDEGDIDMFRILRILKNNGYNGVLIPDHTPQMSCDAPWHAGMAYTAGYMKAAIALL
mgnify:CR=1 FL=1